MVSGERVIYCGFTYVFSIYTIFNYFAVFYSMFRPRAVFLDPQVFLGPGDVFSGSGPQAYNFDVSHTEYSCYPGLSRQE